MVQGLLRRVVNVTVVYMFILLVNLITIFGVSRIIFICIQIIQSLMSIMGGILLRVTQQFSTPTGLNLILSALQAAPTWLTFLAWAKLAAYLGCSTPQVMKSLHREAVTQTSNV